MNATEGLSSGAADEPIDRRVEDLEEALEELTQRVESLETTRMEQQQKQRGGKH